MTNPPRWPHADAHRRASEDLRSHGPERQRERMRAAGVVGVTPRLGDELRVVGRLGTRRYGIVVGADQAGHGRVHVAHDDGAGGVVEALDVFAAGRRVELIQRALPGREYDVAAHAMARRGCASPSAASASGPLERRQRPHRLRALGPRCSVHSWQVPASLRSRWLSPRTVSGTRTSGATATPAGSSRPGRAWSLPPPAPRVLLHLG